MKKMKILMPLLAFCGVFPLSVKAAPVYSGCYIDYSTYEEICPIATEVILYDISGVADFYYEDTYTGVPGTLASSYLAVGSFEMTTVSNSDTGAYSVSGVLNLQPEFGLNANYTAEFSDIDFYYNTVTLAGEGFTGDFSPAILIPGVWEIMLTPDGIALNTIPNSAYYWRDGIVTDADTYGNSYVIDMSLTGTVSSVPVPAAIWLFVSGIAGLTGLARRKKQC